MLSTRIYPYSSFVDKASSTYSTTNKAYDSYIDIVVNTVEYW